MMETENGGWAAGKRLDQDSLKGYIRRLDVSALRPSAQRSDHYGAWTAGELFFSVLLSVRRYMLEILCGDISD